MQIKLFSSVKPALLRKTLLRGSLLGGLGAFILLLAGTLLPLAALKLWGIPAFISALLFIALGLIPYKVLVRLEENPYLLTFDGQTIELERKEHVLFSLPATAVEKLTFVEKEHYYGIAIVADLDKISVDPAFLTVSKERCPEATLFCPYFSERSLAELAESLKPQEA